MTWPSQRKSASTNRHCETDETDETDPMYTLGAAELLDVWDAGRAATPSLRSVLLLSAFLREETDVVANRPLGGLNKALLRLRAHLFGSTMNCIVNCPQCHSTIEAAFGIDELLGDAATRISGENMIHSLSDGEWVVDFRLPTAADLLAIAAKPGSEAAVALLERLVTRSAHKGELIPARALPEEAWERINAQISELDPMAFIELGLTCPECRNHWLEALHVIDFLWAEIGNFSRNILLEVARLASAFGWSEREILALTAARRRSYLGLLGA